MYDKIVCVCVCVCDKVVCEKNGEGGGARYRIKKKNPVRACGEGPSGDRFLVNFSMFPNA